MKYILVAVDYVSKWIEVIEHANNEGKSVTVFMQKNIFSRVGTPRAIISYGGPTCALSFLKVSLKNMEFPTM